MSKTARILVKGSTLRTLYFFIQVAVLFFMTPFVVYSLGDRMYGFWTFVGMFIGYYGLLDFGLSLATERYIASAIGAEDKEEWNRIFNISLLIFTGIGLIALLISLILALVSPWFWSNIDDASLFSKVVLILGINMAIEFPLRAFTGVLTSQLRFDIMSILQLLTLFFRTALIVLVLVLGYKVLAMALVTALSGIPEKILKIYFAKKSLPTIQFNYKVWKRSTAKTLFSYSFYSFIFKIADILKFQVDFIVITALISLSAVTHYKIGSMLALQMQSLMVAVMGFMLPVFSRLYGKEDYDNIKKTFFFANKISIYIASFIGFGLIFWGKPFIEIWMGPDYLDAYPVLLILVLGLVFAFSQVPSLEFLLGTTGYKFVGIMSVIEGVCNLILSLILVRHFGLIGVALGTFIPISIVKLVIQPIYVSRVLNVHYFEYIQRIAKTIGFVFLALIVPALISKVFAAPNYTALLTLGFISFSIFTVSIWFFGFSSSEGEIIRGAIFLKRTKIQVAE